MNKLKAMSGKKRMLCAAVILMLFAVQLVMHTNCDSLILDDWVFRGAAEGGVSIASFLAKRWQTWSSRLLIEGLLCVTTKSIWLWRVLDSLAMVLMAFSLCRLANAEKRPEMLGLAALLVTSIPFAILRSTGWQATGMNYYVPLACAMTACIPLADTLWKRKTPSVLAAFAVLCAVLGANQEQTAALIFGAHLVLGAAVIVRDKRMPPFAAAVFAVACAELAAHLLCPGNALRAQESVAIVNLRDYGQFTLIDKLDIGLTSTEALLIYTFNPILLACGAVVCATVFARRRGVRSKLVVLVAAAFVLCAFFADMTRTSELFAKVFAPFNEMRSYALLLGAAGCGEDVRFVMMTLATILLGMMTLSLYLSIGDRPLSACAAFVFALGFAARMAVSFSPTVVESGERTMLPLYGAMMLCALLCLRDVRDEGGKKKPIAAAYAVCALTAAVNFASSFMLAL